VVFLVGSSLFILFGGAKAWADPPKQSTNDAEAGFTADLNRERTSRGLSALTVASDLAAWARQHSADMASAGKPYHDPNIQTQVHNWQVLGDNVGSGPNEPSLHTGFMNSQVHRDEILEPRYTEVGVGCYWAGNVLYVTEVFRLPMSSASTPAAGTAAPPAARPAPRVVSRAVTPAAGPQRAVTPTAAAAPAPAPAPTAPPTTTAAAPATSTTAASRAPVEPRPTADTFLTAAKRASSSPTQSPVTFAAVIAALLLMGVGGVQVAALKRRAAHVRQ
jgi:uncharacterized protein YkwD